MSGKNYASAHRSPPDSAAVVVCKSKASVRRWRLAAAVCLAWGTASHTWGQATPTTRSLPTLPPESWQVIYAGESQVGHSVMRWQTTPTAGGEAEQIVWTQHTNLTIRRSNTVTIQKMILTSVEQPGGTVEAFLSQHIDGDQTTTLRGSRKGDCFQLTLAGAYPTDHAVLTGATSLRGLFALEQSLAAAPLCPGEQRQLRCLFPLSTTAAELILRAGETETTDLLHGEASLLRISGQIRLAERGRFDFDCWQDKAGSIQKIHMAATGHTTFAATRDDVIATPTQLTTDLPDLAETALVPAQPFDASPHQAQQITYRLRAQRGTLKGLFPSSGNQTVGEQPDGSVLIRVETRSGPPGNAEHDEVPDSLAACLRPNHWIESDDKLIERMSSKIAAGESDFLTIARALATHVSEWLKHKDYGRACDSAATVARSRRGDCTEHAVLTAALCRARGIAARIAYGLVYLDSRQSFASHAWTEVWINGEWVGLDATRDPVAVGAGHIKLGDTDLSRTTAQLAMLPLTQLLGQGISVEVTQAPLQARSASK